MSSSGEPAGDTNDGAAAWRARIAALEQALECAEDAGERYRLVTENTFDIISEVAADGVLLFINERVRDQLGWEPADLMGTSAFDLIHPDDIADVLERFTEGVSRGVPGHVVYRYRHADGTWRWYESTGNIYTTSSGEVRGVSVARDVTERRRLEEASRRARELESLGELAGGVAHKFNNLLSPVLHGVGMALDEIGPDAAARELLSEVSGAAEWAASLCRQLLAFTGRGHFVVEALDLSSLVEETLAVLEVSVAPRTLLAFEPTAGLPPIEGDAAQLRQLVLALVANAAEACEDAGNESAVVRVRTGVGEGPEQTEVSLEVLDSGPGMDELTRSQMFDPLFSTRGAGRGLGLAAAQGIVRGHGGRIEVESEPGEGTCVRVSFPAHATTTRPDSTAPSARPRREGRTVLVVDDDEAVRKATDRVLARGGFETITACDGAEGVEVFRARQGHIDAVLLDVTMPRMSGPEALVEMARIDPAVPVLLTSGYREEDLLAGLPEGACIDFVPKPCRPGILLAKIRAALGIEVG